MNIYDKANELASILKVSPEVVDYRDALKKIEASETSKKMVEDFRKKQMELYSLQMEGKELTKEQVDSFNNLAGVISLNNDVRMFLEAEFKFSRLWEDIIKILGDAAGIDFSTGSLKK